MPSGTGRKMSPPTSIRTLLPPRLKSGDRVRLVSPASTPSRDSVHDLVSVLESWGLRVELGTYVFSQLGYLARGDDERQADVNEALSDPGIRAIFATRGGKGSYRIADRLDFQAAAANPKFVIGFSDITALHLALYRACRLTGMHGSITDTMRTAAGQASADGLRRALMTTDAIAIESDPDARTALLTTRGKAAGPLIGGNLDTLAICAGWALPNLDGAILLIEAIEMGLGHVDRQLSMLAKAGYLKGVQGIAVGQFMKFDAVVNGWSVIEVLRSHFDHLSIPILGGLPIGHGANARTIPIGTRAVLDADAGTLQITVGAR